MLTVGLEVCWIYTYLYIDCCNTNFVIFFYRVYTGKDPATPLSENGLGYDVVVDLCQSLK